ncbi:4-alpha-glucanotransferase [Burkholderia sp. WAC0059]|uniref:4-alpha-glucanotransferase n=1 Tax=Burkholderia sp. WAC0059 TaxID=2066022 RepID=UPI000C7F4534|nr:4-alpha-glucanotransferase [Burkholderia sp. WAC0059]PLZ01004.1 4-alpha-glucanotransferase [Burkholderia sp. WAC0059]
MSAARRAGESVASLAARAGFEVDWTDAHGVGQRVDEPTLARLLDSIGLPCASALQLRQSAAALVAGQSARRLPPLVTAECERVIALPASAVRAGSRYRIELESGARIEGRFTAPRGAPVLLAPVGEPGYHTLLLNEHPVTLAVAPSRGHTVEDAARAAQRGERPALWGMSAQLYGLRRPHDGGLGDYTALAELASLGASYGADVLALSPTHAMFSANPAWFSPYAPSSRHWLNVAHVDPAALFGTAAADAARAAVQNDEAWRELETSDLIDWPRAVPSKLRVLRTLYDDFDARERRANTPRAQAFEAFCAHGGTALEDHARFETLHATLCNAQGQPTHWRDWPAELRDARGAAVESFADEHRREVDFHRFLQWLAADGLAQAQRRARDSGMAIGLVADLAVGCDGSGSETWSQPQDMLAHASIGAPPDLFNQAGQNWGLTTFSPRALQANGFRAFIGMLRAAFAHAGGVRIDHILGLRRLWLVPEGESAKRGAYLRYPFDDLLRLIALESWRHRAVAIGEDLGTVPPGLRERLASHGLHGIRVLWFEREGASFVPPGRWDANGIATTTTHDLPTVAGWWRGNDIDWRDRVGQTLPRADGQNPAAFEHAQRAAERAALWEAMQRAGVATAGAAVPPPDAAPVDAALAFVASGASPLVTCPLEDLLGLADQPNLPGSVDEHPNWRRRLPVSVEALPDDAGFVRRVQTVAQARRQAYPAPEQTASGSGRSTGGERPDPARAAPPPALP